jgi:two-component system chemotaxis response regulator CheY
VAKIMIVDDASFMRMMIRTILVEGGHEIVGEAVNGEEALKLYSQTKPDLITMDITMPEMDGVTCVKHLRAINPDIRVIMCSAMGQKGMVLDAIQAGAKDFIVKPFQKEKVLFAVCKQLDA